MTYEQRRWEIILETDKKSHFAAQGAMTRFLNEVFLNDSFYIIDHILRISNVSKISTELLITILSSTLPAKSYMPHRKYFVKRVREHFTKQQLEVEDLLRGLE